jgi:hypothetical protein
MSKKTHPSAKPPTLNFTYEGDMLYADEEYRNDFSSQMEILKTRYYDMVKSASSIDALNEALQDYNDATEAAFGLLREMYNQKLNDSNRAGEEVQGWETILKETSIALWQRLDEQKRSSGSQSKGIL